MRKPSIALAVLLATAGSTRAEETKPPSAFTVISPIFSELVMFQLPSIFTTVFEQPSATNYIREAVPKGETVEKWTEMITVTGAKGLARTPQASAQGFAANIAAGFKRACPDTFAAKPVGPLAISGHDGFVAVASCGKVGGSNAAHSETALIVAIKGAEDIYTIQWAERRPASAENLTIDQALWKERLSKLSPVRGKNFP